MSKWLARALRVASKSPHPKQKLGCLVIKGGAILSQACNSHRWGRCAERRALRPHANLEGAFLIVVRIGGRCSKPCKDCSRAIQEAGIKEVFYVTSEGVLCSL
jgi:deoxycytidylate deaminase